MLTKQWNTFTQGVRPFCGEFVQSGYEKRILNKTDFETMIGDCLMGDLIDAWNKSQREFTTMIRKIIDIAGANGLKNEESLKELRAFFNMIDLSTMKQLLMECCSKDEALDYDAREFVFQNLVNEIGCRLGYDVENRLYHTDRGKCSYDSIWRYKDNDSCIIVKSILTGIDAFNMEYTEEQGAEQKISGENCSTLVVYGWSDTYNPNDFTVERATSDMRLISSNALFQLLKILHDSKSKFTGWQVINLLQPRNFFVLDDLVGLVFPETNSEFLTVDDVSKERDINSIKEQSRNRKSEPDGETGKIYEADETGYTLPPLPESTLKAGRFVFTAMKNLSQTRYTFSDSQLRKLCADESMKNVIGMQRALPFLKLYNPGEKNGNYIDGRPRFYKEPLKFGNVSVYVNAQIYKSDRAAFIAWYETLKVKQCDASKSDDTDENIVQLIPPLPDKTLKVGRFIHTAMQNLSDAGYVFSDRQIRNMCSDRWMHDVVGMTRKVPFFKIYDPEDENGTRINGMVRYYSQPLIFGNYRLYLTKELYTADKEPFILWYEKLGSGK